MGRLCERLLASLNIKGRDLAVFLLSLLLAFSIWLIHNLSLKYNAYLDVAVKAKCSIDGHAAVSSDQANAVARCRATGYNVIRSGIRGKKRVVEVEFQSTVMKHKEGNLFYVTSADLQEYTHLIYGDGVTVEYFTTDTLFFRFPYENSKRVPVMPVTSISYMSQYMAESPLQVTPDSVIVYGEPFVLDRIESVSTEPIRYHNLSTDILGEVVLEDIRGVRLSDEKVQYSMDVARFVELSGTFPVTVTNVPAGKSMTIFPSRADVYLRCAFPYTVDPLDDVSLEVDYNDFQKSIGGRCVVRLVDDMKGVLAYDIYPPVVECVVEDVW